MINLSGLIYESLNNGPGIRTVIFTQGCKHNCEGCFNPHTHQFGVGRDYEVEDVVNIITRNPLISGVTFSGGDPFEQADACSSIIKKSKDVFKTQERDITFWAYTGYTFEYILEHRKDKLELLKELDVLVDGKFDKNMLSDDIEYRGSSNQRIIDVKKSLEYNKVILIDTFK